MNLAEILRERVKENPGKVALAGPKPGEEITYGELWEISGKISRLFLDSGIRAGDGVLLFLPMSIMLYATLVSLFRIQAIAIFVDPSFTKEQMSWCLSLSGPKAMAGGWKAHLWSVFFPPLRFIKRVALGRAGRVKPMEAVEPCAPDTPAIITFTSGSTGKPKGAMRTHALLHAQHKAIAANLKLDEGETILTNLPIFALSFLASGLTIIIPDADLRKPGEINPDPLFSQMKARHISTLLAPPAFLDTLARSSRKNSTIIPELRKIFTGGGPVFPSFLEGLQTMAPRSEIVALYGSTEAEPVAHLDKNEITREDLRRMESGGGLPAGKPVPEIEIAILPDRWGEVISPLKEEEFAHLKLPPGKPGEIVVSGAHVLSGYLQGIGNEETKFKVGNSSWHRTGDAGYLDDKGKLWLLGRCGEKALENERPIYPLQVEWAAREFPEVRHAAFLSVNGGNFLALELYPRASLSSEELLRKLPAGRIDGVRILKKIPVDKRHNTKIDYPALRKMLERK